MPQMIIKSDYAITGDLTNWVVSDGVARMTHEEISRWLHSEILASNNASTDKHLRTTSQLAQLRTEANRKRHNDPWFTPRVIVSDRRNQRAFKVTYDPGTGNYWVSPYTP